MSEEDDYANDPTTVFGVVRGDRKSTRLNSSHTVISYAVFCLKKKRTDHESQLPQFLRPVSSTIRASMDDVLYRRVVNHWKACYPVRRCCCNSSVCAAVRSRVT